MTKTSSLVLIVTGALLFGVDSSHAMQDAPPPSPKDNPPAASDQKEKPRSLDELLGIKKDPKTIEAGDEVTDGTGVSSATDVADREAADELERRLDQNEIGDAFAEAIAKMGISAEQLETHFDTGLGTQRVQEQILAQLEHLLDEAKKQPNSGSSSSSSSSQSSSESQSQPGKQGQKSTGSERTPKPSDSSDQPGDPAAPQNGDINTIFEEERTEWGTLPQRVRDMLLQGREEKFSSVYEQLTREYYRRLAEEGSN